MRFNYRFKLLLIVVKTHFATVRKLEWVAEELESPGMVTGVNSSEPKDWGQITQPLIAKSSFA